jgi:alpha-2-macroglobulin
MRPLGNMDVKASALPITIQPKLECKWRWVDTKNLACELDHDNGVKLATEYTIKLKKSMKSHDGESLDKDYSHSFSTQRPEVKYLSLLGVGEWSSPVRPRMRIYHNMKISEESLKKAIQISNGPRFYKWQFFDKEGYEKGKFRNTWFIELTEDLEREANYSFTVAPGILNDEGPLGSSNTFAKSITTPAKFRIKEVSCSYMENGTYRTKKFSSLELNRAIAPEKGQPHCEPHMNKTVELTNPVVPKDVYQTIKWGPVSEGVNPFSDLYNFNGTYPTSTISMPSVLKSGISYQMDLSEIRNIFNEKLEGLLMFEIVFNPRSPSISSKYADAVVEKGIGNDIPLLVTNMSKLDVDYETWTASGLKSFQSRTLTPATPQDVSYYFPLGLEQMLDGKSGITFFDIKQMKNDYNRGMTAQVTPWQVFAKFGHYNSLVWVLDLKTGKPVSDAEVVVAKWGGSGEFHKTVKTDRDGLAVLPGLETMSPGLDLFQHSWDDFKTTKFVTVKKDGELAVLPLRYSYNTYEYTQSAYPVSARKFGHMKAWGMTPQGVYRLGSEVEFKIFVRMEGNNSLQLPPDMTYNLTVQDPTGKLIHKVEAFKLNEFGTTHGSFKVPKNASVGEYRFLLTAKHDFGNQTLEPMTVLVADFTPAPFKSLMSLNGSVFKKGSKLEATSSGRMHSGGPFTDSVSRVTMTLVEAAFSPKNNKFSKFQFNSWDKYYQTKQVHQSTEKLDKQGDRKQVVTLDENFPYARISVEGAIKDDRGKNIAASASAEYFGANRFMGILLDKWSYRVGDKAELSHIVLDEASEPVEGEKIEAILKRQKVTTVKVKGSGNAYVTRNEYSWEEVEKCNIESDDDPEECDFKLKEAGYHEVSTRLVSTGQTLTRKFYVVGKGQFLWGDENNNSLALEVESTDLKVGEEVEVLIKNPYPKAKALITIERYGVIERWIEEIEDSAYMLKFKVKPDYIPGFYLSVNLFSPRQGEPKGFDSLDLGKPGYKAGYQTFLVKDPYKKIDLEIETDKKSYYPGDDVTLEIEAESKTKRLGDVEVAIAVLDEAVFDLIKEGEGYFDPYKGLADLQSLDVRTFSLIKQLIGKQKFEKKGANQGGGGGAEVRSRFDFVAYWNPSLKLKGGEGKVKFSLPDNLTGWKVLVLAADKMDRLGLGTSKFVAKLPTEIRPAIPNYLVEGDRFKARFTIMNRENYKRDIKVTIAAAGLVNGGNLEKSETFKMEGNEKRYVEMDLVTSKIKEDPKTPDDYVSFIVKAGDSHHEDKLIKQIQVKKRRPGYWAAQYGTLTTETSDSLDILFPKNIHEDVGGLKLNVSSTLIGHIEEGFKYLKDYPYSCWEQKLSKAVAAAQFLKLQKYFKDKVEWKEADKLVRDTLTMISNYQLPSGAMSYYGKYEDQYLSAFTGMALSWLKDYGYQADSKAKNKLHTYLKSLLRRNTFESWYDKRMMITVRSMILMTLAKEGELADGEVKRFWKDFDQMSRFGQFHYFLAGVYKGNDQEVVKQSLEKILGNIVFDAGKVRFNETLDDGFYRMHSSPVRTQCSGLMAASIAHQKGVNKDWLSDLPSKLARSVTLDMRTADKYWRTTQETIYCMNALISYANAFESEKPNFKMTSEFRGKKWAEGKFEDYSLEGNTWATELQKSDIGNKQKLVVNKEGKGTLYYKVQMSYSPKDSDKNLNHGIEIKKNMMVKKGQKWVDLDSKTVLKRGDLISVDLMISIPSSRHFVVVDDPIPAGFEPVNTQLATASTVDADDNKRAESVVSRFYGNSRFFWYAGSRWSFYHKELRHDRAVFYSTYLPPGKYHVSYKAQAIATGEFTAMPALAQEMYNPETYGSEIEKDIKIVE